MTLFCASLESPHEFMKKNEVRSQLHYERFMTMKPNFSLFDLPKNGFGVLFSTNLLCRRQKNKNSTYTANAKMPTFIKKQQTRKMAGKLWSRGQFCASRFTET